MPRRPNKRAEPLSDGVCDIYTVKDESEAGDAPKEKPVFRYRLTFAARAIGVQRKLLAMQEHAELDLLIRCPLLPDLEVRDIVQIDHEQYEITKIETPPRVIPRVADISLKAVKTRYDISGLF
ncbi:MAG: hypothetical protein RRY79_05015 [Clostridia bacterium]